MPTTTCASWRKAAVRLNEPSIAGPRRHSALRPPASAQSPKPDRQPVARLGDRPHLPVWRVARRDGEETSPQQMVEEALRLHVSEMQTKAHMRAPAKRDPGELVARANGRLREPHRIEY